MTPCEEYQEHLARGDGSLTDSLRAHVPACETCVAMRAIDAQLRDSGPSLLLQPSGDLLRAVAQDHRAIAPESRWQQAGVIAVATTAAALALLLARPRSDLAHLSFAQFWGILALFLSFIAGTSILLLARGRVGLGTAPRSRWLSVALIVTAFEVLIWTTNAREPYSIAHIGWTAWIHHWPCAPIGLVVATAVALVVFRASRHSEAVSPSSAGALRGLLAGLAAVLALHACCGFPDPLHLAVFHTIPLITAIFAGFFIGRRYLAP